MSHTKQDQLFFVGIGGVGMASVAGLAQSAGFKVQGSDQNLYPPTSSILKDLGIPVSIPFSEDNITKNKDSLFVIGNSMSRQHIEVSKILEIGANYTSFPKLLSDYFLTKTENIIICGTHGKTTTSSLLAFALKSLGSNPSYMIGGAPLDLPNAFHWGSGPFFVLEGDEYDTAFFDKGSKFLHYKPKFVVLNNLEFDHIDIFKDFSALKKTFHLLLDQVSAPQQVIANIGDKGVRELLAEREWSQKIFSTSVTSSEASLYATQDLKYNSKKDLWEGQIHTSLWGSLDIKTHLPGSYNCSNIIQTLATLTLLADSGKLPLPSSTRIQDILLTFRGVAKRWEHLASVSGIDILIDFAHHPTAVFNVLTNLKIVYKGRRILAAFEPKNASSRRNFFQKKYADVLKLADLVFIAPPPQDLRIPEAERLNAEELSRSIGKNAKHFKSFHEVESHLLEILQPDDVLVFLTPGDFGGIPRSLSESLRGQKRRSF
jgi:UDP-N-acetylmuramate: L-alanyl-gamma-D-glutamyl-meso-diaminopimelate ligase